MSFQATTENDLETLSQEEIWQGVAKRISTKMQDSGQNRSSSDIISAFGKARYLVNMSGSIRIGNAGGKFHKLI